MALIKAFLMAWTITGTGTTDLDMYAVCPDGTTVCVGSPDNEDGWMTRAGIVAEGEGQTVYVCQAGRVVTVLKSAK